MKPNGSPVSSRFTAANKFSYQMLGGVIFAPNASKAADLLTRCF
jgi:hypothetical protein